MKKVLPRGAARQHEAAAPCSQCAYCLGSCAMGQTDGSHYYEMAEA